MKEFYLNIADYIIRTEATDDVVLRIPEKFRNFLCPAVREDILLRVSAGNPDLPKDAKLVFNAPYVEEVNGVPVKKNDEFWKVWKCDDQLFITTTHPYSASGKRSLLKLSPGATIWDLSISYAGKETDPLEYPVDGLFLYYLTAKFNDIFIHASGVSLNGKGFLFSGISGKGKTTISRLCDKAGGKVIHDDRLIIRKRADGYVFYNTPVYANETPASAKLEHIFLLEHSPVNEVVHLGGAESVSRMLANCIQHNWDSWIIGNLLGSVSDLCKDIPVSILRFRPDESVITEILSNER